MGTGEHGDVRENAMKRLKEKHRKEFSLVKTNQPNIVARVLSFMGRILGLKGKNK